MDLGLLYSNFVMDNKDMTLHTTVDGSGIFRDADGQMHCTIRPFRDVDPDIARDPLSTNRRLFDSGEIFRVHGGGRTDDRRDLHPGSGLYHLHSGRYMPRRCPACDRVEAGTSRKSGLYLAPGGPALVFVRKFTPANTYGRVSITPVAPIAIASFK